MLQAVQLAGLPHRQEEKKKRTVVAEGLCHKAVQLTGLPHGEEEDSCGWVFVLQGGTTNRAPTQRRNSCGRIFVLEGGTTYRAPAQRRKETAVAEFLCARQYSLKGLHTRTEKSYSQVLVSGNTAYRVSSLRRKKEQILAGDR